MSNNASSFRKIRRGLLKAHTIAISGHANPDGDSIGSTLALGLALEGMGKKVYMLCQDEIPPAYRSLPGADRIIKSTGKRVDLAIAVDCSIIDLLDKNVPVFRKAKSVFEIDHHEYRKSFGDLRLIDHEAAAVGELVYLLLRKFKIEITREIAENLLTSIIVETNLFRLANVRLYTFKVCAQLLETGLNFSQLVENVYGPKTRRMMMLSAICLLRTGFLKNGRIAWSIIKKSDLRKVRGKGYDADAIAGEICSMQGVEIAVLFREKTKTRLRVSLRSKGGIDIGRVAADYKGGGHSDIAGCYIPNRQTAIRDFLSSVTSLID